MLVLGALASKVQEWEARLPYEQALEKTEALIVNLSDADFQLVCDLVDLANTEPGKRLFGDASAFMQKIEELSLRRKPVN